MWINPRFSAVIVPKRGLVSVADNWLGIDLLLKLGHILLCSAALLATASCSVPRGAAMSSQILAGAEAEDSDFSALAVDKANIAQIMTWPGQAHPGQNWIANKRGPASGVFRPGDSMVIEIWDSSENSLLVPNGTKMVSLKGLTVAATGDVFLPYIGNVVVSGLTMEQARRAVETRMQSIAPSAQVVLTAQSGVQNSVDMVSGVVNPGTYPLVNRNQTILSMLATGGGIPNAKRNPIVRLIRDGQTYEISARRLFEDGKLDTVVRGGDKIVVEDDNRFFNSLGATGAERVNYFDKDTITALDAVSMSGGLQDSRADPKGVLILREYDPKDVRADGSGPPKAKVIFTFDLTKADSLFAARTFLIHPKDTVLVSEAALPAAQSIISVFRATVALENSLTN